MIQTGHIDQVPPLIAAARQIQPASTVPDLLGSNPRALFSARSVTRKPPRLGTKPQPLMPMSQRATLVR